MQAACRPSEGLPLVRDGDNALLKVRLRDLQRCEVFDGFVDVDCTLAHEVGREGVATFEQGELGEPQVRTAMTFVVTGQCDAVDPGARAAQDTAIGAIDHEGEVGHGHVGVGHEFKIDPQFAFAAAGMQLGAADVVATGFEAAKAYNARVRFDGLSADCALGAWLGWCGVLSG